MNTIERMLYDFRKMNHRAASRLLLLLICADLIFIALHVTYKLTPMLSAHFDLATDRGFPEIFNYLKYLSVGILLAHIRSVTRCNSYFAWVIVFIYFLVDDAVKIHETIGGLVAMRLDFQPPFNLRLQDFGEIVVSVTAGGVLFAAVAIAYRRGSSTFRNASKDLLLLILILAFFGILTDMVNAATSIEGMVAGAMGVVEDGGEMIASSLLLCYVFLLALRRGEPGVFLHDFLRRRGTGSRRA